jgi:hypothetical protein
MPAILALPGQSLQAALALGFMGKEILLICGGLTAAAAFYFILRRFGPLIDANALGQAQFLDSFAPKIRRYRYFGFRST